MNVFTEKFKEVLFSVLPITFMVVILHFSITPLETIGLHRFLLGALFIIFGLTIFLVGVDLGITPIGNHVGGSLAKSGKLLTVIVSGLILGFFISVAEPDLHILGGQVALVTSNLITKLSIVMVVSVGVAVLLTVGLVRIVYNFPLYKLLTILYGIIFILALFISSEFLAVSFDASGATTGALTVPFILALATGVAALKKDSKASEKDSFGLVGVTSAGAIFGVMIMSIISSADKISGSLNSSIADSTSLLGPFFEKIPIISGEIVLALSPVLIIFFVFQKISFHLDRRHVQKILKGLIYMFLGLVLFLTGVNAGFMDIGSIVGSKLASLDNYFFLFLVAFFLGLVTILAEPAVYVLTHQIEEVTSGYVKRSIVMLALSIGVGIAVLLSIIRIVVPGLQLWHYLLPGYMLSIILSFFTPKLFVGIAFDSGGVASGPMTATFVLAFAQGVAHAVEGADVLMDGFGVIAMVAMTPLIALQLLGLVFKVKSRKGGEVPDGN